MTDEQRVRLVQLYSGEQVCPQLTATPAENYGLNYKLDPALHVMSLPWEINQVLIALGVIPQMPETMTFKNSVSREKSEYNISRYLRTNTDLYLAPTGAQASCL